MSGSEKTWTPRALLAVAREAARAGAAIVGRNFGRAQRYVRKGTIDLVTSTDLASEKAVLEVLARRVPGHAVLAEESGAQERGNAKASEYRWLIDPLDGTTNFAHGYPFVCTSVGVARNGVMQAGVVLDPVRGELYAAARGLGATLNGRRIHVSGVRRVHDALLVTGFPYDVFKRSRRVMRETEAFLVRAQGIRRDGSAALNLCYVAAGRFDGFWELKLHPWDVAAGSLIVAEAGGKVTDYAGGRYDLSGGETIASNGLLHPEMKKILKGA